MVVQFDHVGFPMLVATSSTFLLFWMEAKVMSARKLSGVPYPNLYASHEEAQKDVLKMKFNCCQRAHQNTLEKLPSFLVLLALATLTSPFYAGIAGSLFIFGRINYAIGYASGDPKGRSSPLSALQLVGFVALLGMSIKTSLSYF